MAAAWDQEEEELRTRAAVLATYIDTVGDAIVDDDGQRFGVATPDSLPSLYEMEESPSESEVSNSLHCAVGYALSNIIFQY